MESLVTEITAAACYLVLSPIEPLPVVILHTGFQTSLLLINNLLCSSTAVHVLSLLCVSSCECLFGDAVVSKEPSGGKGQPLCWESCFRASGALAAQGFALELYCCCPHLACVLAWQLNAFASRWFKECLLLVVVRWELPSVGAQECPPTSYL